jgi:hypothetical protein
MGYSFFPYAQDLAGGTQAGTEIRIFFPSIVGPLSRAQGRLGYGDRHGAIEIVPVPLEELVGPDVDENVQIPRDPPLEAASPAPGSGRACRRPRPLDGTLISGVF